MRFTGLFVFIAVAGFLFSAGAEPLDRARHKSPDGRFAIRYDVGEDTEIVGQLDSSEIKGIRLVAVSSGKTVATLLPEEDTGNNFGGIKLVWSADSQWCAFYYAEPRVGYLRVFHRVGTKFVEAPSAGRLHVSPERWLGHEADVRNEYLMPVRWLAPGRLLLEQFTILRGKETGPDDLTLRLTAQFSKGRFRVVDVNDARATKAHR
jgi:hypothetical protein